MSPLASGCPAVLNLFCDGLSGIQLPNSPLFGTDGIRGQVGEVLTAPLAMQIGYWAGQVLRAKGIVNGPVIVGQDSRNSGHIAGDSSFGGDYVRRAGRVECRPLPDSYRSLSVGNLRSPGGRDLISASHNPPGDNGIKFFRLRRDQSSPAALQAEDLRRLCEVSPPSWMCGIGYLGAVLLPARTGKPATSASSTSRCCPPSTCGA